ncbi:hypothetical protein [Lichenicola cladoniae]|uniref:hypothetical protein n=1 Tax=Lichenicola cladoniae TaxID=1484109 RepID=UPI001EF660B4|nr:hypothetical protein [Lichenicola cladoniae]
MPPDIAQFNKTIDGTKQMIGRHMVIEVEPIEQGLLSNLPLAHHCPALHAKRNESAYDHLLNGLFQRNSPEADVDGAMPAPSNRTSLEPA